MLTLPPNQFYKHKVLTIPMPFFYFHYSNMAMWGCSDWRELIMCKVQSLSLVAATFSPIGSAVANVNRNITSKSLPERCQMKKKKKADLYVSSDHTQKKKHVIVAIVRAKRKWILYMLCGRCRVTGTSDNNNLSQLHQKRMYCVILGAERRWRELSKNASSRSHTRGPF